MTNKFYIYANDSKQSQAAKAKLTKALRNKGCVISEDAANVIVLGGDGTFVHAYNKYANKNVRMALINTGFVGFYSVDLKINADKIIEYFNNDNNFIKPDVVCCQTKNKKYYAINEVVVEGGNTISCDISINNNHYEWFWGSGLCFCTKTGSTGWNKSLRSAILMTKTRIWQMSEMSPLAHAKYLSVGNPVVLDGAQKVTLSNFKVKGSVILLNDGFEHEIDCSEPFTLYLTQLKAKIGFYKDLKPYLNKIKTVFLVGEKK